MGQLSAAQYEEKIDSLQNKLQLTTLKNEANNGTIRKLKAEMEELKNVLEEERVEKEKILKDSNVNKLMSDLRAERVQRLQDLEYVYQKDREIKTLATEAAGATKGALLAQHEATHNRAEIIALRKTLDCSSKLVRAAEKDYKTVHQELEETRITLLKTKRLCSKRTEDMNVWIDRYQQAMIDLHMTQKKLEMSALKQSSKGDALVRGYGTAIADAGSASHSIPKQAIFYSAKKGSAKANGVPDDMALRKHHAEITRNLRDITKSKLSPFTSLNAPMHTNDKPTKQFHAKRKNKSDTVRSQYIGRGLGFRKSCPVEANNNQRVL